MNILILGGAGLIGYNLAEVYINKGYNVLVIDNLSSGWKYNYKLLKCDKIIYDAREDISKYVEWSDIVVNCAELLGVEEYVNNADVYLSNNLMVVFNILANIRRYSNKRYVMFSSSAVRRLYFNKANAINIYGLEKQIVELVGSKLKKEGYDIIIIRPNNVVGVGQNMILRSVFPSFARAVLNKNCLPVYGDGRQKRIFVDVEVFSKCVANIIINGSPGIYDVKGDKSIEVLELAKLFISIGGKITGYTPEIKHVIPKMWLKNKREELKILDEFSKLVNVKLRYDLSNLIEKFLLYAKRSMNEWKLG